MEYAYQAYTEYAKKGKLTANMGPEQLRLELCRFWDDVMLSVSRSVTDAGIRNAYRLLLQQARAQAEVLNWLDEPEVFYSTAAADKGRRRAPWLGILGFLLLAGLAVWFAAPHQGRNLIYAGLTGAGALLALIQCVLLVLAAPTAPAVNVRTEQRISPEKVYSGLQRMAREIDASADSLQAILSENAPEQQETDVTLAQELMRIPAEKRSSEVDDAVDRFLIRQGVEKVEYTPDRQELFMILPAQEDRTVEPALIKDGRVLCMGVACTRTEEKP